MLCPFCGRSDSKVIDTRASDDHNAIRRRRECLECQRRFTTYERLEETPLIVIKKDERREVFDRSKLLNGVLKACEKRPVPVMEVERLVDTVERELRNRMEPEVRSTVIGDLIMEELKKLDGVAYVRFASVYREFKDVETLMCELQDLLNKKIDKSEEK
jgi:transcriptional repressor NrdR